MPMKRKQKTIGQTYSESLHILLVSITSKFVPVPPAKVSPLFGWKRKYQMIDLHCFLSTAGAIVVCYYSYLVAR